MRPPGCRCDYDAFFGDWIVRREVEAYRRHGARGETRRLIDALIDGLRAEGVPDASVLDIGGGMGAIGLELMAAGATTVELVEASGPYLEAARQEAERRGSRDRLRGHHGDFVALAGDIEPADVVTLDKVVCCYPDWSGLVESSVAHARRLYGLVYPIQRWWIRLAWPILNGILGLFRQPIRVYLHPQREIDARIRSAGFEPRSWHRGLVWQTVVYRRVTAQ
jgi:magnesium-protoporphyrin O-methyltransferase